MQNHGQASRWGLNVMTFVILLPLLPNVQLVRLFTPEYIQMVAKGARWLGLPAVILMIALYAASFILILWKGRVRLAILVAFINCIIILISPLLLVASSDTVPRRLAIHKNTPGIDVFCNDVYLGKTPLEISEEEFHEKVKPWNSPPRQKMILGKESATENARLHNYVLDDTELRQSYIPYDYFGNRRYFDQSQFYGDVSAFKSRH